MDLLPMDRLGAREISPGKIRFGVLLPWVSAPNGNRVQVKIIHEHDQFLQQVPPVQLELVHSVDAQYGDYWSLDVDIAAVAGPPGSAWGTSGTYIYRYQVVNPNVGTLDWIVDPFAREFGIGKLSAFTLGFQEHPWSANEQAWKTPALHDLVMYELQLEEFGGGLGGAIERFEYLADLGVNCLEIMPVSNVALTVDWGFLPVGYFGVDERFGNRADLQRLVDAAHRAGLAVILDVVYGHTSDEFPYCDLYRRLRYVDNPFLGDFAKNLFGESTDFRKKLTQDFFFSVNQLWLDRFHVDGFRYDCVPNYWDGPTGQGFANLAFSTLQAVKAKLPAADHWQRFDGGGGSVNLIQCAEQLEDPQGVLYQSYANCTWQNGTLASAGDVAHGDNGAITRLGHQLGLVGYPLEVTQGGETLAKSALQYIENHDHSRFLCQLGLTRQNEGLFQEGDRGRWYALQPYLIGLLTGKGIPMLWQGEELAENYFVPEGGLARVMLLRPVRWDYFYDDIGKSIVGLVRKLLRLRRQRAELRRGEHFFYDDFARYQSRRLLLFSRRQGSAFSLVALNFGDAEQQVSFAFPLAGTYEEQLHGQAADRLVGVTGGANVTLRVPGNYGRIWSL